jgi:hypothetical protein
MDFNVHFQTPVLSWPVDPNNSVVQFEDLRISAPVSVAGLVFALLPGTTVPVATLNLTVTAVSLTITWPEDTTDPSTPFKLEITVTAGVVQLSYNLTLSNLSRTTTLRKCLTAMGATTEALQLIRVPKLLGLLVDNASAVYQSLLQSMPTFLAQAGMAILTPDLDASSCDGTWTATRQVAIAHADVVCEFSGLSVSYHS